VDKLHWSYFLLLLLPIYTFVLYDYLLTREETDI